jgi:hypothetical protein
MNNVWDVMPNIKFSVIDVSKERINSNAKVFQTSHFKGPRTA